VIQVGRSISQPGISMGSGSRQRNVIRESVKRAGVRCAQVKNAIRAYPVRKRQGTAEVEMRDPAYRSDGGDASYGTYYASEFR